MSKSKRRSMLTDATKRAAQPKKTWPKEPSKRNEGSGTASQATQALVSRDTPLGENQYFGSTASLRCREGRALPLSFRHLFLRQAEVEHRLPGRVAAEHRSQNGRQQQVLSYDRDKGDSLLPESRTVSQCPTNRNRRSASTAPWVPLGGHGIGTSPVGGVRTTYRTGSPKGKTALPARTVEIGAFTLNHSFILMVIASCGSHSAVTFSYVRAWHQIGVL